MNFDDYQPWGSQDEHLDRFHQAWDAVKIVRHVSYGLFTFGESELPYYLVTEPEEGESLVSLNRGQVKITRPMIITPDNAPPELSNFLESQDDQDVISHLLARTASFRHLKMNNTTSSHQMISDSVEEIVDRIARELDKEEEDHVAILTAPAGLGGMAVLRYTVERIMASAPDNVQELRERGFLK